MKKIRILFILVLVGLFVLPFKVMALPNSDNNSGELDNPRGDCTIKVDDATITVTIWGGSQIDQKCSGKINGIDCKQAVKLNGLNYNDFVSKDKKYAECTTKKVYAVAIKETRTGTRGTTVEKAAVTLYSKKPSLSKDAKSKLLVQKTEKFEQTYSNKQMIQNQEKQQESKGKYNKEAISRLEQKETTSCSGIFGSVTDKGNKGTPASLAYIFQQLFNYLKILGPLLVIVLSGIDFAKTVLAGDDEGMQKATKKLGIRLVLVVLLYFIPDLAKFILSILNGGLKDPTCGIK